MAEQLADLAKSWVRDLRAADKAERTIVIYGQSVRFFTEWLAAQGRNTTLDDLTREAITDWLESLRAAGQATATMATRFRGLRRFCRWLVADGELDRSPMEGLEQPAAKPKPVPILSDEQVSALFKATAGTEFADRRDHAILRTLFDCGLRIGECANLAMTDVDMDTDVLYVMGKGRKPRSVPFGAKTGRALDRYLRARLGHKHADEPKLWLTQRGGMSADGLDDRLRVIARRAGIPAIHAHQFRHTFAHRWLADGGAEQDLKRLVGWSSDAMLSVYGASAADERAREAFRKRRLGDRL